MKRLVALITAFCLIAQPAWAGWTVVTGGGAGGTIGTATGGAVVAMTFTVSATVPVGSLVVIGVAIRSNSQDITGCVDTSGNTYARAGTLQTGGTIASETVYYAYVGTALTNGVSTITCTQSVANSQNRLYAMAFTGAQTPTANNYDLNQSVGSTSASTLGPLPATGALGCNSTNGNLLFVDVSASNAITVTAESTGFTNVVTENTFQGTHIAYQITSTNASVTYNPTETQPSGQYEAQITNFKAASCNASTSHGLLLRGVGQ
jgi:hypothetical protein